MSRLDCFDPHEPWNPTDVIDEYPDVADELELELRRFVATLR